MLDEHGHQNTDSLSGVWGLPEYCSYEAEATTSLEALWLISSTALADAMYSQRHRGNRFDLQLNGVILSQETEYAWHQGSVARTNSSPSLTGSIWADLMTRSPQEMASQEHICFALFPEAHESFPSTDSHAQMSLDSEADSMQIGACWHPQ